MAQEQSAAWPLADAQLESSLLDLVQQASHVSTLEVWDRNTLIRISVSSTQERYKYL
jgi:hypothetical protein